MISSCKETTQNNENNIENTEVASTILPENIEEVDFKIDGMTCEMGCAKTIEYKVANTKGVDSVFVDFETNLAHISFDKTQQTKEELKNKIESLVDGNTYKVSELVHN